MVSLSLQMCLLSGGRAASANFLLHVNEITLTVQYPDKIDSPSTLKSSFEPMQSKGDGLIHLGAVGSKIGASEYEHCAFQRSGQLAP